ncbi:chalcone isomerase family protein [Hahella sp. SMD15-11]|uniref:Chalcone isomerase family protein n=1 Tax=Thermohahella caldifontis TaxID=3142973 RepID=A0AB39UZN2_9GAMM
MNKIIATLILALSLSPFTFAAKVADVEIPDAIKAANTELKLNGAGVRTKWFMDIYVGGLYLPQQKQNPEEIIKADEPMAIKLHMVSGLVSSDKMKKATMEGFENSTHGNIDPIAEQIDEFMDIFSEEIKENDVFDLVYQPGKGVEVYKNGTLKSTIDGGLAFKEALFGIWLSDKPAQENLKQAMLGAK